MFKNRSKQAVVLLSFLSIFIFTLTANVIFNPAPAVAGDVSQRDTESETADASKDAKGKLSGAASGVTGFFGGIWAKITGVTDAVNDMWGMENGSGMAMAVNVIFYIILIGVFGFLGKMLLNIFTDIVKGKNTDQRYQKPSFRKK